MKMTEPQRDEGDGPTITESISLLIEIATCVRDRSWSLRDRVIGGPLPVPPGEAANLCSKPEPSVMPPLVDSLADLRKILEDADRGLTSLSQKL